MSEPARLPIALIQLDHHAPSVLLLDVGSEVLPPQLELFDDGRTLFPRTRSGRAPTINEPMETYTRRRGIFFRVEACLVDGCAYRGLYIGRLQ